MPRRRPDPTRAEDQDRLGSFGPFHQWTPPDHWCRKTDGVHVRAARIDDRAYVITTARYDERGTLGPGFVAFERATPGWIGERDNPEIFPTIEAAVAAVDAILAQADATPGGSHQWRVAAQIARNIQADLDAAGLTRPQVQPFAAEVCARCHDPLGPDRAEVSIREQRGTAISTDRVLICPDCRALLGAWLTRTGLYDELEWRP